MAPSLPDLKTPDPAIQLTAAVDPIAEWQQVLDDAEANLTARIDEWRSAPFPVVQQFIANQIGYVGELPDVEAIAEQVVANLQAAAEAPFVEDQDTLDPLHLIVYNILVTGIPGMLPPLLPAELVPIVAFSTSSLSGVLLGLVGPVIGPALALVANTQVMMESVTGETPSMETALNALVNTPANMADAFLNGGQVLDLTPVISLVGSDLLPEGTTVGVKFGGLLSPGGSIFNALDLNIPLDDILGVPADLAVPGQGPGAIGSLIDLSKVVAKAIGWEAPEPAVESRSAITGTTQQLVTLDVEPKRDVPEKNTTASDPAPLMALPDEGTGGAGAAGEASKQISPKPNLGKLVSSVARTDRPLLNVLKHNPLARDGAQTNNATAVGSDDGGSVKHRPGIGKTPVRDLVKRITGGDNRHDDKDDSGGDGGTSADTK
ncbi:hypothetical protein CQY20_06175 [Mycolicibacterium agri]|uniref:PE-PGRS family protein n=1 Tax=Mycolicibacterium agri TaxID=36811 RepID=A0A2A7NBE5_MYCAG|nr:hypothetical protein CQY20_06175 [Mycolicibacterium agri]